MMLQDVVATPFKPLEEAELGLPAIEIKRLSKRFMVQQDPPATVAGFFVNLMKRRRRERREFWALENVSMSINTGETVGVVGPNGSGKSTLLKLMAGIYRQTYGEITIRRHLVPLLELGAGFHPELSGRENIYLNGALLGKSRKQMNEIYEPIVKFSGIGEFINTPLKFYSSGMKVRLGFSVAIHIDAEIMLLDEIFAVGDDNFQTKCIKRLRQFQAEGRTLVLVSHGMEIVNQLCDRAFWIQGGRLMAEGKASDVTSQYTTFSRSHGDS